MISEYLLKLGNVPAVHKITGGRIAPIIRLAQAGRIAPIIRMGWEAISGKDIDIITNDGFKLRIDLGDSLGIRDIGEFEPEIRAEMRRLIRPGDLVVDVGANIGYHTVLMASLGARVIAIEPIMANLTLLEHNLEANGCELEGLHPVAVSDREGKATMWTNPGGSVINSIEVRLGGKPIEVRTDRLDQILPPGPIRLIKMDIEGHEAAAIRGLGDRLHDVDYIIYEHWETGCDGRMTPDPAKLLEGWKITRICKDNFKGENKPNAEKIENIRQKHQG